MNLCKFIQIDLFLGIWKTSNYLRCIGENQYFLLIKISLKKIIELNLV